VEGLRERVITQLPAGSAVEGAAASLGQEPTQEELNASLRCARVEVTSSGAVFTGRILSLERSLVKRYTAELNTQEDSLGTLRRGLSALQQQRDAAANDLKNRIESLTLDEKVGG
jgi:hypothetical protein